MRTALLCILSISLTLNAVTFWAPINTAIQSSGIEAGYGPGDREAVDAKAEELSELMPKAKGGNRG